MGKQCVGVYSNSLRESSELEEGSVIVGGLRSEDVIDCRGEV